MGVFSNRRLQGNGKKFSRSDVEIAEDLRATREFVQGPDCIYQIVKERVTENNAWDSPNWQYAGVIQLPVREDITIAQTESSGTLHYKSVCEHAHYSPNRKEFPFNPLHLRDWTHKFCKTCLPQLREHLIFEQDEDHLQDDWRAEIHSGVCDLCELCGTIDVQNDHFDACYYCGDILYEKGYSQVKM